MKTGTIDDATVRIQVLLGEAGVSVKELSQIGAGTILELESMAGEPVNILAAGRIIARGEVVIIDEHFGVRVSSVMEDGHE